MSASEKLKVYLPYKDWDAGGDPFENQPSLNVLAAALPQIVAVVKAAEDAADHFIDQSAHDHGWPIELKAALAALEEVLS